MPIAYYSVDVGNGEEIFHIPKVVIVRYNPIEDMSSVFLEPEILSEFAQRLERNSASLDLWEEVNYVDVCEIRKEDISKLIKLCCEGEEKRAEAIQFANEIFHEQRKLLYDDLHEWLEDCERDDLDGEDEFGLFSG